MAACMIWVLVLKIRSVVVFAVSIVNHHLNNGHTTEMYLIHRDFDLENADTPCSLYLPNCKHSMSQHDARCCQNAGRQL
jgi:hypothetical protein